MPMPDHRSLPCIAAAAVVALVVPDASCLAAGTWISDTGGADMGMAGAGRAALSLDAAALSANPAALSDLPGGNVTVAAMPLELEYVFRGSPDSPAHATNQQGITTLPAAYVVHHGDRLSYGLGAYSYFGMSFEPGDEWAGRRAVEQAGLATFNVGPAFAWSVSERLSVGASVAGQWIRPEIRLAVANDGTYYGPPFGLPDGQLELSGESWGLAGQLGVTWRPRDRMQAGLAWTAPVDHTVPLNIAARNVHPALGSLLPADGATKLELTLPQQLLLGVSQRLGRDTLVTVGGSWQDWSVLGEARQQTPGQSAPIFPAGLRDTWGAAVGARRTIGDRWIASGGVGYESSPATDRGVPAYFPVAEQWKFAVGAEYPVSDSLRLRGGLSLTLQGEARVVQEQHPLPLPGVPAFAGTYEDTRIYALVLAADFRR